MSFFRRLFFVCVMTLGTVACETADGDSTDVPVADAPVQAADALVLDASPDAGGAICCRLKESLRQELEAAGTDVGSFVTACAQFDDSATYPGSVGQELCGQLMDGRWCEWTCA